MQLRVLDFEVLTSHFTPYIEGVKNIESEKRKMIEIIEPDRKEMEDIIRRSQSGLIVNESSKQSDMEKFRQLQEKLVKLDSEFKKKLKEMQDEVSTNSFERISVIVNDWAEENSIDLVIGNMEVVFKKKELDSTNDLLDKFKQLNLYHEDVIVGEVVLT